MASMTVAVSPDGNAEIHSGSAWVVNSATATTVLTIPAGRTWYGTVAIHAQYGSSTAAHQDARLDAGANTILRVTANREISPGALAVPGVYLRAGDTALTVQLINSTATDFRAFAALHGVLVS